MEPFSTAAIGLLYSYPQQVTAFISRGATHHTDARDLYQRRRKLLPINFASKSVIHGSNRFFYMPQSWDMGQILLLPLRRHAYWGFSGRPGVNPRTRVPEASMLTTRLPKPSTETYFDTVSLTYGYSLARQIPMSVTTKPQILRASKHTSK